MITIDIEEKPPRELEEGQVWVHQSRKDCFIVIGQILSGDKTYPDSWLAIKYDEHLAIHPEALLVSFDLLKNTYMYLCDEDDIEIDSKITINFKG